MQRQQAQEILETYPVERIQRQLEWLPFRSAKFPAGFLASAIAGDYDAPTRHYPTPTQEPNTPPEVDEVTEENISLEIP